VGLGEVRSLLIQDMANVADQERRFAGRLVSRSLFESR